MHITYLQNAFAHYFVCLHHTYCFIWQIEASKCVLTYLICLFFLQIMILLPHSFFTGLFKLDNRGPQDVISLREHLDLLNSRDHQKVIHSNGYGK